MEYSKSPRTPPQVAVGLLCNLFRRLNNIHPLIPLALIAAVVGALGWATGWAIGRLLARSAFSVAIDARAAGADGPVSLP